jgi:hypothetical protein
MSRTTTIVSACASCGTDGRLACDARHRGSSRVSCALPIEVARASLALRELARAPLALAEFARAER